MDTVEVATPNSAATSFNVARRPVDLGLTSMEPCRILSWRRSKKSSRRVKAWHLPAVERMRLWRVYPKCRVKKSSRRYVNLDEVSLDHPPQSVPPVSTGVRGPKSLALSGRVSDGTILAECAPPAYVAWARERISEGAAEVGRREEEHRLTVYALCKVDRDSGAARKFLRPVVAETLVSGGVGAQISPLGITENLEEMIRRGGVGVVEKEMPDEWLDQLAVVGNPGECVAAIDRLGEAGADTVVLVPSIDQPEKDLDDMTRELLPLLVE